jgi:hypothetical protein
MHGRRPRVRRQRPASKAQDTVITVTSMKSTNACSRVQLMSDISTATAVIERNRHAMDRRVVLAVYHPQTLRNPSQGMGIVLMRQQSIRM